MTHAPAGYRVAALPPAERVTVMGRTERASVTGIVVGGALLLVGMVGGFLLSGSGLDWDVPAWSWGAWLLGFAVLAWVVASTIRRLRPAFVIAVEAEDVKLLGLRGELLGGARAGSLGIHAGRHEYVVDKTTAVASAPALLLVAPGVRFTLHAGLAEPLDQRAPSWGFPVPIVERPRHVVPLAAFETLRSRRTEPS